MWLPCLHQKAGHRPVRWFSHIKLCTCVRTRPEGVGTRSGLNSCSNVNNPCSHPVVGTLQHRPGDKVETNCLCSQHILTLGNVLSPSSFVFSAFMYPKLRIALLLQHDMWCSLHFRNPNHKPDSKSHIVLILLQFSLATSSSVLFSWHVNYITKSPEFNFPLHENPTWLFQGLLHIRRLGVARVKQFLGIPCEIVLPS